MEGGKVFCFSLSKTTEICFGSTKMGIFYREKAFHAGKKNQEKWLYPPPPPLKIFLLRPCVTSDAITHKCLYFTSEQVRSDLKASSGKINLLNVNIGNLSKMCDSLIEYLISLDCEFTKKKKKTSSKWIDSSSEGHLQDFSSILKGSSSKIVTVNWIRGQRSNKSLIFVRNIEVGFLFLFVIFMMSIKLLFNFDPSITLQFLKRNLVKLKRNLVSVPWKSV